MDLPVRVVTCTQNKPTASRDATTLGHLSGHICWSRLPYQGRTTHMLRRQLRRRPPAAAPGTFPGWAVTPTPGPAPVADVTPASSATATPAPSADCSPRNGTHIKISRPQRSAKARTTGWAYAIREGGSGRVKIGRSENPMACLTVLRTGSASDPDLPATLIQQAAAAYAVGGGPQ